MMLDLSRGFRTKDCHGWISGLSGLSKARRITYAPNAIAMFGSRAGTGPEMYFIGYFFLRDVGIL